MLFLDDADWMLRVPQMLSGIYMEGVSGESAPSETIIQEGFAEC